VVLVVWCPPTGLAAQGEALTAQSALFDLRPPASGPAISWERQLLDDLRPLGFDPPAGPRIHLALMLEPYMGRVEQGVKTIESRWGKVHCAPHGQVTAGDAVVFKRSGGPIRGWSTASWAKTYALGADSVTAAVLVDRFRAQLGVADDFAAAVGDHRFATLIGLGTFHPLEAGHVVVGKTSRAGWVILRGGR